MANNDKRKHWLCFYSILLPSLLFGGLAIIAILAPILEEFGFYWISNQFYSILSNICHQYPTRSLWIMNRPMGLCSRCFALYASFSISLILIPKFKDEKSIGVSCIFFLPLISDGLLQYYDIRESSNLIRVISGTLFGVAASVIYGYFVLTVVNKIIPKVTSEKVRAYDWINPIIGGIVIFLVNLYGMAAYLFR
jgi:uncharacterized membrane protein